MMSQAVAGASLAIAIASLAWYAGSLSRSGAVAAAMVGTLAVAASWSWGFLLIWFFVTSSALTRWRGLVKAARTHGIVEKGGKRVAAQVLANGALFALSGACGVWSGSMSLQTIGLGSLATAAADTFATEVGTAVRPTARMILSGRSVASGTSGAISAVGTLASVVGAATIAGAALVVGFPPLAATAAGAGGVAGAFADTLLGATVQERRHCPRCNSPSERLIHDCGTTTHRSGGIAGFRNDAVNVASGAVGGIVSVLAWSAVR